MQTIEDLNPGIECKSAVNIRWPVSNRLTVQVTLPAWACLLSAFKVSAALCLVSLIIKRAFSRNNAVLHVERNRMGIDVQ